MGESLKRVAIVDCGTNTFTMVIVDLTESAWTEVFRLRCQVFLGRGGFSSGAILPDRFAKGLDALGILKEASLNYDVQEVRVFGTSALRDASNADEFMAKAQAKTGWEIEVIDGATEADLIQLGVQLTLHPLNEPLLIMDIGGGSLEFIIVAPLSNGLWEKKWSQSFDAGVSRLAEFGKPSDPLTLQGANRYTAYLDEMMRPLVGAIEVHQPRHLVGSSGSFDTFYELVEREQKNPPKKEEASHLQVSRFGHHGVEEISREGFTELHARLLSLDLPARLALPGMAPARARLIPLSSMLVHHVLATLPVSARLYQSPYALREGALSRMIK
jgi:exopolyphosphatase/guanosine-5'-triphosphate,3'-diphosphate pyrophosphatase